jgi:hypothetical protein
MFLTWPPRKGQSGAELISRLAHLPLAHVSARRDGRMGIIPSMQMHNNILRMNTNNIAPRHFFCVRHAVSALCPFPPVCDTCQFSAASAICKVARGRFPFSTFGRTIVSHAPLSWTAERKNSDRQKDRKKEEREFKQKKHAVESLHTSRARPPAPEERGGGR